MNKAIYKISLIAVFAILLICFLGIIIPMVVIGILLTAIFVATLTTLKITERKYLSQEWPPTTSTLPALSVGIFFAGQVAGGTIKVLKQ